MAFILIYSNIIGGGNFQNDNSNVIIQTSDRLLHVIIAFPHLLTVHIYNAIRYTTHLLLIAIVL